MYRRRSINVYRCAELHKFQAILKDDTDPASACPRTLLVAKTAGRKNLTRELPGNAGLQDLDDGAREKKIEREREREKKSQREANGEQRASRKEGKEEREKAGERSLRKLFQ